MEANERAAILLPRSHGIGLVISEWNQPQANHFTLEQSEIGHPA